MSVQRKPGRYSDDEIAELRTRWSNEKVDALVAEADAQAEAQEVEDEDLLGGGAEGDEGKEPVDYDKLNKPELVKLLEERNLSTDGTNKEQADRLRAYDANLAVQGS